MRRYLNVPPEVVTVLDILEFEPVNSS
jgi:hypothetical protein